MPEKGLDGKQGMWIGFASLTEIRHTVQFRISNELCVTLSTAYCPNPNLTHASPCTVFNTTPAQRRRVHEQTDMRLFQAHF